MEHRGLILIVFALTLIFAPLAIRRAETAAPSGEGGVRQVVTVGAAQAACDAEAIQIRNLRLGCQGAAQTANLGR